ncbi:hypothetical protein AAFC00_004871 [Neodothiora populina]|uniref:Siderophore iron transporter n=1 Tax=Neodothiora populina TaxID=2781224 RepID=A0ABR3P3M2_9PEZI
MRFRLRGLAKHIAGTDEREANSEIVDAIGNSRTSSGTDIESGDPEKRSSKEAGIVNADDVTDEKASDASIDASAQHGTQAVEAMTHVWGKKELILVYVLIWIIYFIMAFSSGIVGVLTPYVTSAFESHSLTPVVDIISTLIAGLWKLPYAKILDIWGRPQGFACMVASMTLGLIMMAACNNVKTYAAAQVFYYVGWNGIDFSFTIFIADTSKLRHRAFALAFVSSPYIATTWASGPAAERILATIGFRWGFGIWAIIMPVVCAPLFLIFWFNHLKADKMGLIPKRPSRGDFLQTVLYYGKEFDVIGLLLLSTGLSLFLLSFSIYTYQAEGWKSPMIICFIVFGILLTVAFAVWERFAPTTFVPWYLLKDRTVIFTYVMAGSLYTAWYIWNSYFYSLLIVLFDESVTNATYIGNIYTIGSCAWTLLLGVMMRYYGRVKHYALFFGVPVTILGVGLMIKFRQPDVNIGFIVMTQIFIAFGGGTLVICEQITVMAVCAHNAVSAVLACEAVVASIGSSIGLAIAGAMWTSIFPVKLAQNLPADSLADLDSIYGDITVQSSYPMGSPTRDAINLSYGQTQRLMLITATCLYSITLVSTMFWRDIDVKKMKQREKGLI